MYWSRGNNVLVQRPFGNESKVPVYDSGLVFTDGTVYAPQMPWYMSHYCSSTGVVANTVCDDDYFTARNDGFSVTEGKDSDNSQWPNTNAPWSVYPNNATLNSKDPRPNHCAQYYPARVNLTTCTLVLAAFDLWPVEGTASYSGQFQPDNAQLFVDWFNSALARFSAQPANPNGIFSMADFQRHFPWRGTTLTWGNVAPQAISNPFLGQYAVNGGISRADHFLYPRRCSVADLATSDAKVTNLRNCAVNMGELHPNGWSTQWPATYQKAIGPAPGANMLDPNQYGRTSFLFAGVPGMQLPVSYYKNPSCGRGGCLSVYEQVHNASLFSLYLPIANDADYKLGETNRWYTNLEFYHTLLMTNHLEQDKDTFAEGIRGRTLWHNEYRSQVMYGTNGSIAAFPPLPLPYPAAFATANAPYHNYTCDGCHVRNGSGIPIKPNQPAPGTGMLDPVLQGPPGCPTDTNPCFMNAVYSPYKNGMDYTFTGEINPMKLVFFDLNRTTSRNDPSVYSKPAEGDIIAAWRNKIMNFYGDSFHVTKMGDVVKGNANFTYSWSYGPADANRLVVTTARVNSELKAAGLPSTTYTYVPQQVNLGTFTTFTTSPCIDGQNGTIVPLDQRVSLKEYWPQNCAEINGAQVATATNAGGGVGFMLLNGKRLGNLGAMEAIPNGGATAPFPEMSIQGFQQSQKSTLGSATVEARIPPAATP